MATLVVRGLAELQRGFRRVESEIGPALQTGLQEAGDLVARDVTQKALQFWAPGKPAKARVTLARVYVQTTARSRHVRGEFGKELMEDAYEPGLEENTEEVTAIVERTVFAVID